MRPHAILGSERNSATKSLVSLVLAARVGFGSWFASTIGERKQENWSEWTRIDVHGVPWLVPERDVIVLQALQATLTATVPTLPAALVRPNLGTDCIE